MPESQLKNTDAATRDAILKLKPGQFSEVIPVINPTTRQQFGYRIIKLLGKETAGQRDLNDPQVQQFIRNQLRSQREQILRAAYDEVLRDNAEVHNYYAEQILKIRHEVSSVVRQTLRHPAISPISHPLGCAFNADIQRLIGILIVRST